METRTAVLATVLGVALTTRLATPSAAAPASTTLEQRILAEVERQQAAALALLERATNINSGTLNTPGVRAVGALFSAELERLGFTVRWLDGAPFQRAGHLLAARDGNGRGPRVLLIGHLDTVFEADSPFQRFERTGPDSATGPGVIDMKGGDVVMIGALAALHAARALDDLQVRVFLTGDEESTGAPAALARAPLLEVADWADIAIGFENAANDPATAVVARRGSTWWRLEVEARTGHASQIFKDEVGAGAIFETARILEALRTGLGGEPYLTFNPGLMVAGTTLTREPGRGTAAGKNNVIAARSSVEGDLRALTPEQFERAQTRMNAIVVSSLPHARATLTFSDSYPPLAPSDGNRRLLARFSEVSVDLGHGPVSAVDPGRAGAADISFTAGRVEMAIDGLGMMGTGEHSVAETADLRTLPLQMRRTAVLLHRLARDGGLAGGRPRRPSATR